MPIEFNRGTNWSEFFCLKSDPSFLSNGRGTNQVHELFRSQILSGRQTVEDAFDGGQPSYY